MSSPKVIVFDLGKVLVDFDYSIAARKIAPLCKRPADPARFFSQRADLLGRYELGLLTTPQFYAEICAVSGYAGPLTEFSEFFADIFSPMNEMIALHAELRQKNFPTYIFSNTNDLAITHIRRRFPFFKNFDGYILSYEHGSMKPDAGLYEVVERETKCCDHQIVYIDDRPENIEAGRERGWHAVLHETAAKTGRAIAEFFPT